jgi:hypothetical protein
MLLGLAGTEQARDDVARCLSLLDGYLLEPMEQAWLRVTRPDDALNVCCPDLGDPSDALWVKARAGFVVWCGPPEQPKLGVLADWPFDWVLVWSEKPDLLVSRVTAMLGSLLWRRA